MRKRFVGNLLLLLILNFLVKPFWLFGIDRTVQNIVGEEAYGRYFSLVGFTVIFNILLDAGLTHYNNQSVAKDHKQIQRNFSNLLGLKLLLGVAYLLVTLGVGFVLGFHHSSFTLLAVLALSQFFASLVLFLRSNISGLQLFRLDSLLSIADKSIMVIICGVLLYTPILKTQITVLDFALAQLVAYVLTAAGAFFIVLRKVGRMQYTFRFSVYRKNLYRSFPYALLILLMALYTRIDSVMLDLLVGPYYSGVYAAAFRLIDAVNQVGYLFAVLLLPLFANLLAKKINVGPLVELNFNLILAGTVAISLACFFYAEPLMKVLYVGSSDLSVPVLRLLMLSTVAFGSTFIFGTLLTASGSLSLLNKVAFAGFVLNIVLNLLLIPKMEAYGAALATVITQSITALIQLLICLRLFKIEFSVSAYWGRVLMFVAGSVFLSIIIQGIEGLEWMWKFALTLAVTFFLSAIVGFFKLREAIDLLGQRFR
jgi:O-antigen/teichoic acid export membrane protein